MNVLGLLGLGLVMTSTLSRPDVLGLLGPESEICILVQVIRLSRTEEHNPKAQGLFRDAGGVSHCRTRAT